MKKLISIILSLAISMSLAAPAYAVEADESVTAVDENRSEVLLEDGTTLVGEDLSNGDARFTIIENDEVISEAYLNRNLHQVTLVDYSNGEEEIETKQIPLQSEMMVQSIIPEEIISPNSFLKYGTITYNFYGGNAYVTGTRKLDVYCDYSYVPGVLYDVNGEYKNAAELAAYITGWLSIPVGIANPLAGIIIATFGQIVGGVGIIIPECELTCNKTSVTWKGVYTQDRSVYGTIAGTQYAVVGAVNKTYTQGTYLPQSSYYNRSTTLATGLYTATFGQDIVEIVSWG